MIAISKLRVRSSDKKTSSREKIAQIGKERCFTREKSFLLLFFLFFLSFGLNREMVTVLKSVRFDCNSHSPQNFLCRTAIEVKITVLRGSSQLTDQTIWFSSDLKTIMNL